MLCVPAKSPGGSRRPTQGTNPHEHKTEWEVCTKRASTPHLKHASAQGDSLDVCVWGGESYRIRVLASTAVLIKDPVHGSMMGQSIRLAEAPSSSLYPARCVCEYGCGAIGAGLVVLCRFLQLKIFRPPINPSMLMCFFWSLF